MLHLRHQLFSGGLHPIFEYGSQHFPREENLVTTKEGEALASIGLDELFKNIAEVGSYSRHKATARKCSPLTL